MIIEVCVRWVCYGSTVCTESINNKLIFPSNIFIKEVLIYFQEHSSINLFHKAKIGVRMGLGAGVGGSRQFCYSSSNITGPSN